MNSQVSVVLPVFNAEVYLNEALKSVLEQKGVEIEVIVVDDGSSDSSPDILRSFSDSRLRIVRNNDNRGLIYSLNKGIDLATSPYIARMDADDICLPGRLLKQYNYLESHPHIDVVSSWSYFIDENGKSLGKNNFQSIEDNHIKYHLLFGNIISHPSVLARREIFDAFRYEEDYFIAEDYGLWANIVIHGKLIHVIDEPLIKYRVHEGNVSQNRIKQKRESVKKIMRLQMDRYQLDYSPKELNIQTSFSARRLASEFRMNEIEGWLKKLYEQLIGITWNEQITREVMFYYYMQIYLTRYKNKPWKWFKYFFINRSFMPEKLVDRIKITFQVISSKTN